MTQKETHAAKKLAAWVLTLADSAAKNKTRKTKN